MLSDLYSVEDIVDDTLEFANNWRARGGLEGIPVKIWGHLLGPRIGPRIGIS